MNKKQIFIFVLIISIIVAVLFLVLILFQSHQKNIDKPSGSDKTSDIDKPSDTNRNEDGKTNTVKKYYDFSDFEGSPTSPTVCKDKKTLFYLLNCECQYFDLVDVEYKIVEDYYEDYHEEPEKMLYTEFLIKLKVDNPSLNREDYFREKEEIAPGILKDLQSYGINSSHIKSSGINFKDFNIKYEEGGILSMPYGITWISLDDSQSEDYNMLIYATIQFPLEIDVPSILNSEQ